MHDVDAFVINEFADDASLQPLGEQVHGEACENDCNPAGKPFSNPPHCSVPNRVRDIFYSILILRINGLLELLAGSFVHDQPDFDASISEKSEIVQREDSLPAKPGRGMFGNDDNTRE